MKYITFATLLILNTWISDFNSRVANRLHIVPQPGCSITASVDHVATAPYAAAPIPPEYEQYLTATEAASLLTYDQIASWLPRLPVPGQ